MKKVLQKMSLLGMLLMLCIGVKAADVTATWDWQNANPESIKSTNIQGTDATGTVASDVDGIQLDVLAAVAGTNIKLQYNASGYAQFNNNTAIRVPVKSKGDLVTVVSYPGQSKYTVGGEDATGQNTFTHTASASEASKGYVEVIATATAYLYSISVVQYEAKEPTTLDNEPATATFPFNLGTSGQKATFSNADYWIGSKVATGSNMGILDSRTISDVTFTRIQPKSASASAAATDYVLFRIQPKFGFTFTPKSVSLKAYKDGTGNGKLTIKWVTADGTETEIASNVDVQRNNATPPYSSFTYDDLSKVTPVEGVCGLKVYIGGNLATNKQVGLSDVVIEGTLSGTEVEVPVLGSFTINGTEYTVDNVFGDDYEATLKLSKSETMVSSENPLTATAISGEVGTITYDGDATQCTVTIPMTAGDVALSYVLSVVQKPDYTLTYYDVEGNKLTTQTLEEDQTIGAFAYNIEDVSSTIDGYKARGWFKNNYVGEKHKVSDVVTSNLSLYAVQTEIEYPSESKKYVFDLTDKNFDPADHEAFTPVGTGKLHTDPKHGWVFGTGDQIQLLTGTKASIILSLCQYSADDKITASNGAEISSKVDTDGGVLSFEYEGEAGTLTLTIGKGSTYIHKVTILNTAETNYEKDGQWIKVKAGDASSLVDAIDAANGTAGDERVFIYLPNGVYDLAQTTLTTVGRSNVSIIGESMEGTIIKNRPVKEGIAITATILNTGSDNYFQDLTLDCIAPYGTGDDTKSAERGVCLQDKGNQTICKNVYLKGLQDTYYNNNNGGTYYFEDSKIEGSVDFVCGNGDVYFNKTDFYVVNKSQAAGGAAGGVIAAPNTLKSFGYIFSDCTIDGMSNEAGKYRLGRPWADNGTIIRMINTTMKIAPKGEGWDDWGTHTVAQFGEYNSNDADGNPIDVSKRKTTIGGAANNPVITAEEASNYAVSAIFSGDWKPNEKTVQAAAPKATISGNTIKIVPADGGDAGVYLIEEKNGGFVALTSDTEYTFPAFEAGSIDVTEAVAYTVRAANAMGGFGEAADVTEASAIEIVEANAETEASQADGTYVIDGKVVIVKEGKKFSPAGIEM